MEPPRMSAWCLTELPFPGQPLPAPALFMYGSMYFALVKWRNTLLESDVIGPLQRNSARLPDKMPVVCLNKVVRHARPLRAIFAAASGEWVHGRHVLPDSNLSYFQAPQFHPQITELQGQKVVMLGTSGLQEVLNNMNLPNDIVDPLQEIARDVVFSQVCTLRQSIVFAERSIEVRMPPDLMYKVDARIAAACGNTKKDELPEDVPLEAHVFRMIDECTDALRLPMLCAAREYNSSHNCIRGEFFANGTTLGDCWVSAKHFCAKAELLGATVETCDTYAQFCDMLYNKDQGVQDLIAQFAVPIPKRKHKKDQDRKRKKDALQKKRPREDEAGAADS